MRWKRRKQTHVLKSQKQTQELDVKHMRRKNATNVEHWIILQGTVQRNFGVNPVNPHAMFLVLTFVGKGTWMDFHP